MTRHRLSEERWTHARRLPGPDPDRCVEPQGAGVCGCERARKPDDAEYCLDCGHDLVPAFSRPPSDSPMPPR